MNDHELIAAVANRLGWTKQKVGYSLVGGRVTEWKNPEGRWDLLPPWPTSVDAALGLLDKGEHFNARWRYGMGFQSWEVEYKLFSNLHRDESLPRAILLAFLGAE